MPSAHSDTEVVHDLDENYEDKSAEVEQAALRLPPDPCTESCFLESDEEIHQVN